MPRSVVTVVVALAIASLPLSPARAATTPEPWDQPFRATAQELLDGAGRLASKPGDSILILIEDGRVTLAQDCSLVRTYRLVYRVLDDAGVREWGSVGSSWEPWREERPGLRARVVTPDGVEHALDPRTIDEAPTHDDSPDVLTSSRVVRAPLPGLAPGSVVELETTLHETAPLLPGIASGVWSFGGGAPAARSRFVVDAPAGLGVTFVPRLLTAQPLREERDGRAVTTYEVRDIPRGEVPLMLLAPDVPRVPRVGWTTAASWSAVASAYAAVVDAQAQEGDVADAAREAANGATDLRTAAARCLAAVHAKVRYTGLEFGEAAIVPVRPAQCRERGYGDCKDKATLLVAMLRALGHRADVALLMPGRFADIDADVPGVGQFTHAIVATGDPPLFIDATIPEAAVGEIPDADRNRLALVARRDTVAPVRTPLSTPESDRTVETVEMTLAEDGPASLTELTEEWGAFAISHRAGQRDATAQSLKEGLTSWARGAWLAESVDAIEASPADDLTAPTRLRYRALESRRGNTEWPIAVAALPPGGWTQELAYLEEDEEPPSGEEEALQRAREKARTAPLQLPRAFSWERRYRIVPPPGYVPAELPQLPAWTAGPASLASSIESDGDAVTASYRFTTGPGVLTPEQATLLRSHLKEMSGDYPLVTFRSAALVAVEKGDVAAAFTELRRLAALHPTEALHHQHVAALLIETGLGDAALSEARRAVELEPGSAAAHAILAEALLHDVFARRLADGADVQGAVAALRKAHELDPEDLDAWRLLADLLGRTRDGLTDWSAAGARASLEAWRGVRAALEAEDEADPAVDLEVAAALARAGAWDELQQFESSVGDERQMGFDALVLAGECVRNGADAALRRAAVAPFSSHDRSELLKVLGATLVQLRRYPEASRIYAEAARGSREALQLGASADRLASVTRQDRPAVTDDPRSVALAFTWSLLVADDAGLRALVASGPSAVVSPKQWATAQEATRAPLRRGIAGTAIPFEVILDSFFSLQKSSSDPDGADGARVEIRAPGAQADLKLHVYLRRQAGAWKVLALAPAPVAVASVAKEHLAAGRVDVARRWATWASEDAGEPAELRRALAADDAGLRAATARLSCDDATAAESVVTLEKARESATEKEDRAQLDVVIATCAIAHDQPESAAIAARRLLEAKPSGDTARLLAWSLEKAGRHDEAMRVLDDWIAKEPEDVTGQVAKAELMVMGGDVRGGYRLLRDLEDRGKLEARKQNNLAWFGLVAGESPDALLAPARAAASVPGEHRAASLHTLATVLAEARRSQEARQVLLATLDARPDPKPTASDWYVLGVIAQDYGEIDAARDAYRKAAAAKDAVEGDEPDATSTQALARRKLAALEAKSAGAR